jgi:hypothetical protein
MARRPETATPELTNTHAQRMSTYVKLRSGIIAVRIAPLHSAVRIASIAHSLAVVNTLVRQINSAGPILMGPFSARHIYMHNNTK